MPTQENKAKDQLTDLEVSVLRLVADGLTTRQICDHLAYSKGWIEEQFLRAKQKLGANNRVHAVMKARELGLIGGQR